MLWFLSSVYPHMDYKIAILWEILVTLVSLIYFLSYVKPHIDYKFAILGECLVAMTALVWSLTSVNPNFWECFVTLSGLIWSFISVNPHIILKNTFRWECLVTLTALIWSLSSVNHHVTLNMSSIFKSVTLWERFVTNMAIFPHRVLTYIWQERQLLRCITSNYCFFLNIFLCWIWFAS